MEEWTVILSQIKKNRKKDILECAKAVFMETGFAHVTMKDIADRAGISRTTLYKYFSNIDEIAYTIQVLLVTEIDEYETQEVDQRSSSWEKIESILDRAHEYTLKHPENRRFTMMFDSYYMGDDAYRKDLSEEIVTRYRKTMETLQENRTKFFYKVFGDEKQVNEKQAEVFSEIFCGLVIAHNQRIASGGYQKKEETFEGLCQEFKKIILNYFQSLVQ